ncbi:MAG: hypothetical protein J5736_00870, partial [Bacilli bacterium]|nr:hypothetical protein [Bacilli bacterium]
ERVGDYILTTTTTTKHTRNKSSGTTVFPDDGEWAGKLKVDDFDDDDVCGLGSVNGLDIRWFRIANGLGFDAEPMTQKQLYKKARKTAESEDKGKSVSITWTDLVVLVPIFSVYRVEDNKTIFCMNLYNKTVAIDDVPLVPELDAKLVKYTKLGNLFKWLMVAAFVFGQLLPPIVSGKFGAAFPIIAAILSAIVMIILICCSSSGRLDVRQKLIKNPEGGFVKIQLTLFIMFIIYVAMAIGLGMAALVG